jgi:hypothetical protein
MIASLSNFQQHLAPVGVFAGRYKPSFAVIYCIKIKHLSFWGVCPFTDRTNTEVCATSISRGGGELCFRLCADFSSPCSSSFFWTYIHIHYKCRPNWLSSGLQIGFALQVVYPCTETPFTFLFVQFVAQQNPRQQPFPCKGLLQKRPKHSVYYIYVCFLWREQEERADGNTTAAGRSTPRNRPLCKHLIWVVTHIYTCNSGHNTSTTTNLVLVLSNEEAKM